MPLAPWPSTCNANHAIVKNHFPFPNAEDSPRPCQTVRGNYVQLQKWEAEVSRLIDSKPGVYAVEQEKQADITEPDLLKASLDLCNRLRETSLTERGSWFHMAAEAG